MTLMARAYLDVAQDSWSNGGATRQVVSFLSVGLRERKSRKLVAVSVGGSIQLYPPH